MKDFSAVKPANHLCHENILASQVSLTESYSFVNFEAAENFIHVASMGKPIPSHDNFKRF